MNKNYIGEKNKNTFGTEMIIVEFNNKSDITVEFQDQYKYRKKTNYQNYKKGQIKNPYDKTIYGVAWLGDGKYPTGHYGKGTRDSQRYDTWRLMIGRCYEPNCQSMYPAYNGIVMNGLITKILQNGMNKINMR